MLVIRDLSAVVPGSVPQRAAQLQQAWSENWEALGRDDETAVNHIDGAIDEMRNAALTTLTSLH